MDIDNIITDEINLMKKKEMKWKFVFLYIEQGHNELDLEKFYS